MVPDKQETTVWAVFDYADLVALFTMQRDANEYADAQGRHGFSVQPVSVYSSFKKE